MRASFVEAERWTTVYTHFVTNTPLHSWESVYSKKKDDALFMTVFTRIFFKEFAIVVIVWAGRNIEFLSPSFASSLVTLRVRDW